MLHELYLRNELDRLFKDVVEGDFYRQFQSIGEGLTRDQAKIKIYQAVMGSVDLMENSPVGKRFKKVYPQIFAELVRLKRDNPLIEKRDPRPYRWVVQKLQRAESKIVIDGVCETLRLHHRDVPFLTVHDSIMVPERSVSLVIQLLEGEFSRRYGRVPRLKNSLPLAEASHNAPGAVYGPGATVLAC